jgi:hypothetical protein
VFLSAVGLGSPQWRAWLTTAAETVTRLIPVRIAAIDDTLVPDRLAELNWIDWDSGNARVTFGYVLAGLFSDPSRRDVARQLSHEAQAWMRSGRSDALLIGDYRQARRMAAMLSDLEADQLAAPTAAMRQFVQRSVKLSRPKYRRRRNGLIVGTVGLVLTLLVAAVAIPAIKLGTFNDKESVVVTGDPVLLEDLPNWSAANAAALLIDGTPQEKTLARSTLLRALSEPWEVDALQWQVSPDSAAPFDHGQLAIVSFASGLAIINVDTQQVVWTAVVTGGPYVLSVDPAGNTALGFSLSGDGAIVINLDRHTLRHIAMTTEFFTASEVGYGELGSGGMAVVALPGPLPRLGELNSSTGSILNLGTYPAIAAVAAKAPGGTAAALIYRTARDVDLIAIPSRRVLASLPESSPDEVGAISPDGRQALVQRGGQFWEIGAGQPARPTGIPVPPLLSEVTWATGDRIVVASEDGRGQVYYLPRAELLGTICTQSPRLTDVTPDTSSAIVACVSQGGTDFWRLPPGPLPHREPGEVSTLSWTAGAVTVTTSGPQIQIRGSGGNSGMYQPLSGDISAVDVADGGTRVVVGDTLGEVAVIDVEDGYTASVVAWNDPDSSPITAVGWDSGPVVTTASGQTWQLADCAGCGTDIGLLRAFRARITGCFSARQLSYMGTGTWQALGLHECTAQPGVPGPPPAALGEGD